MRLPDRAALGTMHGKAAAIAPPLARLGITLVVPTGLDTDRFGTFTPECPSGDFENRRNRLADFGLRVVRGCDSFCAFEARKEAAMWTIENRGRREVSRDTISALRGAGFVSSGPRSPTLGAPYTYVTTKHFLSAFGLDTLRDLPDVEKLEDAGLLNRSAADPETLSLEPDDDGLVE